MASSSDYFRSMFTSGMKESTAHDIELKGVNARGLDKLLDILYTSSTTFDAHSDMFDTLAAASHLQCLLVVEFCEKYFLKQLTCHNFNDFISMAQLYGMHNALKHIDTFILNNLVDIINWPKVERARNKRLTMETECCFSEDEYDETPLLTCEQLHKCLANDQLRIREVDLFMLTWQWINQSFFGHSDKSKRVRPNVKHVIRSLMKQIRFALISPRDLIRKVQTVNKLMTSDKCLRQMILKALNYHLLPIGHTHLLGNISIRAPLKSVVVLGGECFLILSSNDRILVKYDK